MDEIAPFTVGVTHPFDGTTVVSASGELDVRTAAVLRNPLMGSLVSAAVVLDLSGCSFCDSSGFGLIVEAWQRADVASCVFRIAGAIGDGTVARAFELAGADGFLALFPDLDSALRGLR